MQYEYVAFYGDGSKDYVLATSVSEVREKLWQLRYTRGIPLLHVRRGMSKAQLEKEANRACRHLAKQFVQEIS